MTTSDDAARRRVDSGRRASPIPVDARPIQGHRAGIVSRLIANTLDFGVLIGCLVGIYLGWSGLRFLVNPTGFRFSSPPLWLVFVVAAGVSLVYLTTAWTTTGRTYGDSVLGLRVVNFRGGGMSLVGAALRAAAYIVFPVGVLWVAVSRQNRSLQDVVLRTSVIYDWEVRTHLTSGADDSGPASR